MLRTETCTLLTPAESVSETVPENAFVACVSSDSPAEPTASRPPQVKLAGTSLTNTWSRSSGSSVSDALTGNISVRLFAVSGGSDARVQTGRWKSLPSPASVNPIT